MYKYKRPAYVVQVVVVVTVNETTSFALRPTSVLNQYNQQTNKQSNRLRELQISS